MSVLIRPFILVGCDMYNHAFKEAIHIATVHAKYGANHLEIAVADTNKDNSKSSTASKSEDITTIHLPARQQVILQSGTGLSILYPDVLNKKETNIFLSILVPPPKA